MKSIPRTTFRQRLKIEAPLHSGFYTHSWLIRWHEAKGWRFAAKVGAVLMWPYWLLSWIWVVVSTFGRREARRNAEYRFSIAYWHWFFENQKIIHYTSRDLPKPVKGRLLIVNRVHILDGPFLAQAFPFPTIVPVNPKLRSLKILGWIGFPPVGSLLKSYSYDDLGTDAQYANIKALLKAGHTVVVYLSVKTAHALAAPDLQISPAALKLIREWDDTYLVDHMGLDEFGIGRPGKPVAVRVRVTPISDALDGIPNTD
ncbi:hypothetical protein EBR96_08190, partial [bacterium]|nr:hypothetical protein [bacterium]